MNLSIEIMYLIIYFINFVEDENLLRQEIEKIKSADKKKFRSSGTKSAENIDKINESSKRKSTQTRNKPPLKKIKGKFTTTHDSATQDEYKDDNDTDLASDGSENSLPWEQAVSTFNNYLIVLIYYIFN